ncbi:hypothetical protein HZB88_00605 [archaeon]|nr:hypothetical protein [archaeon]
MRSKYVKYSLTMLILIILLFLSGCAVEEKRCGDGICDEVEKERGVCPEDCKPSEDQNPPIEPSPSGDGILYIGIMVHLEGWADENEEIFNTHKENILKYAELFEEYDAKLTLESKEFTDGSIKFGDNTLKELQKRGHGVGVHADIGGTKIETKDMGYAEFVNKLKEEKEELESLGVKVKHVSGTCSDLDWVSASIDAGYEFTTGEVAYCALSLPTNKIPEEFSSCSNAGECHEPFPTELIDRLHPWRMDSGSNWLEDEMNGGLVILPASGGLTQFDSNKEFTEEDISVFIEELERAVSYTDKGKVNIYYVSWSLGTLLDTKMLEKWLQAIQPYIESGKVQWKTLPEMYDEYVEWEKQNR